MNLASILSPDQVIPSLRSTEHWGAIVEMVDHLVAKGLLRAEARDEVLEALREREDQISTGIGAGVAIPHAFYDGTEGVISAFGRSKEGIEFESIDNAPVHYVILFLVPKKKYRLHLKTLAAIARLFTRREIREQLEAAETREEMLEVFNAAYAPTS